ncbi:ExbD/TolR family protein [Hymenobacter psoromatis]|uniref:ExbD/TolR family protein n=1 Tax=Hymenobacter psoromatis TaxID=1484116 RepID=UPI001CBE027E|nr:biopolymer transporter ExbD [Hymenobacter psoromatis]
MATIDQPAPKDSKKPRARPHKFHLDMTPMVDLAFLLLTFFMLTTTFAKPRVMELVMPVKSPILTPIKESGAMTIILGKGHRVYYYLGLNAPKDPSVPVPVLHSTNFGPHGIRQTLLTQRVSQQQRQLGPVFVLIKSGLGAKYADMVDILDEMNITGQSKYALTDLSLADRQLLPPTER